MGTYCILRRSVNDGLTESVAVALSIMAIGLELQRFVEYVRLPVFFLSSFSHFLYSAMVTILISGASKTVSEAAGTSDMTGAAGDAAVNMPSITGVIFAVVAGTSPTSMVVVLAAALAMVVGFVSDTEDTAGAVSVVVSDAVVVVGISDSVAVVVVGESLLWVIFVLLRRKRGVDGNADPDTSPNEGNADTDEGNVESGCCVSVSASV